MYVKETDHSSYADLIRQIREGDMDAWEELYRGTYKLVLFTIEQIVHDIYQTEDILQDTYVCAYTKIDSLKQPEYFPKWLCKIAARLAINYVNKKKTINFSEFENDDFDETFQLEDENIAFQPEMYVDWVETVRIVNEMLENLPESQQRALALHYGSGLSARDISVVMECKENTAKGYLKYGLDGLRRQKNEMEARGIKLRSVSLAPLLYWIYKDRIRSTISVSEKCMTADYNSIAKKLNVNGNESVRGMRQKDLWIEQGSEKDTVFEMQQDNMFSRINKSRLYSRLTFWKKQYSSPMIIRGILVLSVVGSIIGGTCFENAKTEKQNFQDKTIEKSVGSYSPEEKKQVLDTSVVETLKETVLEYSTENRSIKKSEEHREEKESITNYATTSKRMTAVGRFFNIADEYADQIASVRASYEAQGYELKNGIQGFRFDEPVALSKTKTVKDVGYAYDYSTVQLELPDGIDFGQEDIDLLFSNDIFDEAQIEITFEYWGSVKEISILQTKNGKRVISYSPVQPQITIYSIKPLEQSTIDQIADYAEQTKRYREEYGLPKIIE